MILGIDPGPEKSGWCIYHPTLKKVILSGVDETEIVLQWIRCREIKPHDFDLMNCALVIEKVVSYGQRIGGETIKTIEYIGKMQEAWRPRGTPIMLSRPEVLGILTGSRSTRESGAREALIDLHGGSEVAIGKKASPGPLYGVKSHAWSALALCVATLQNCTGNPWRAGLLFNTQEN